MTAKPDADRTICQDGPGNAVQSLPLAGSLVVVRSAHWKVSGCVSHADCAELHLTNSASGPTVLLWPFDRFTPAHRDPALRSVRLRRWAAEIRGRSAAPSVSGLCVGNARAALLPYQLAPALAAAAGEPRLILADEVGLGKTIQAGWIVADLMARYRDARAIVAVPAGLREQWRAELASRFGLDAIVADARWLRRAFADVPGDVSPWSLPGIYLASIDFLKRPDVRRGLDRQIWDLVVVDESHTAAAPTERHAAVALLARRARRVVAISATPFSGDPRSFESIARLGGFPNEKPALMFRRSRHDVGALPARRHRFASVRISRTERRLQRLLTQYTVEVWRESIETADAVRLAMTVLRKRALSSPRAALRSLERRLDLLERGGHVPMQLGLFADEDPVYDEEPLQALAAPGLHDGGRERGWLMLLIDAARQAAATDSKLEFLQRLLRRLRGDAVIVFTEYRDTLLQLAASFPQAALLHGGMSGHERSEAQRRFNLDGGLLLATDAASEGLNLQGRCRIVVNYELPWNPARLEQRIGRVDRIGQRRSVHALTLVARDTAEDLVIAKLARRLQRIAATLGEHDRLAAFLDEARTARIVIGSAADDLADPVPLPSVTRAGSSDGLAADEAERLAVRLSWNDRHARQDILVSRIRASRALCEGFLFAFEWSASTCDAIVVDTHVFFVHAAESIRHGRLTAARARALAAAAIDRWSEPARAVLAGRIQSRFTATSTAHATTVTRLIDRERSLMTAASGKTGLVQPGLFDGRGVRRPEVIETAGAMMDEHQRRVETLTRSIPLESRCHLVGVLIVAKSNGLA